eukprot:GILK01006868.1.p1 GENE.GILK01006868.1~~GILK01006868.1.p1  ORF type:complete len:121 (-),score=6.61 GILK01006868.1:1358-1720(-)
MGRSLELQSFLSTTPAYPPDRVSNLLEILCIHQRFGDNENFSWISGSSGVGKTKLCLLYGCGRCCLGDEVVYACSRYRLGRVKWIHMKHSQFESDECSVDAFDSFVSDLNAKMWCVSLTV